MGWEEESSDSKDNTVLKQPFFPHLLQVEDGRYVIKLYSR